jgi:hypothetical protein|tara:strand:+ start:385 stop:711 length:327 start_codon:yes stop_codon:yes gene_type:complete
MNRKSVSLTASENLRVALSSGNAVLVQLKGTGFTGSVDFKSSTDGSTWANHPYEPVRAVAPVPTVAQIASVTTATLYLLRAPVLMCRIDCVVSAGTLAVVYRELIVGN